MGSDFVDLILIFIFNNEGMQRPVIVALAAAAFVLGGLGCARDLARASSGVIGCAPDDIAIDDVSVGWSETSWAASCGGTTFRCAGERSPWCAPAMGTQLHAAPELEAAGDAPAAAESPASAPSRAPATPEVEPSKAEPSREAAPESGPAELPPGHPSPESLTDAPHCSSIAPRGRRPRALPGSARVRWRRWRRGRSGRAHDLLDLERARVRGLDPGQRARHQHGRPVDGDRERASGRVGLG